MYLKFKADGKFLKKDKLLSDAFMYPAEVVHFPFGKYKLVSMKPDLDDSRRNIYNYKLCIGVSNEL